MNGKSYMLQSILCLLCLSGTLFGHAFVNYQNPHLNQNITFLLSTPKSGVNVITGSLSVITRRPISWFYWGNTTLDPGSDRRNHPSYNRLGLPLLDHIPLLYRTHYQFDELLRVPSAKNRLIFLTRNPKELLYRKFLLQNPPTATPEQQFIEEFLKQYLDAFAVYEAWCPETRKLIFYEDYITHDLDTLLQLLEFMDEKPLFLDDFLMNKDTYTAQLLESYANQHQHNFGGSSSKNGPTPIHYTKNASLQTLLFIDAYLKNISPTIWENHLKRFQTIKQP